MRGTVAALTAAVALFAGPSAAGAARPSLPPATTASLASAGKVTVRVAAGRGTARVRVSLQLAGLAVASGRARTVRLGARRGRRVALALPRSVRWALSTCAAPQAVVLRAGAPAGRRPRPAPRGGAPPPPRRGARPGGPG